MCGQQAKEMFCRNPKRATKSNDRASARLKTERSFGFAFSLVEIKGVVRRNRKHDRFSAASAGEQKSPPAFIYSTPICKNCLDLTNAGRSGPNDPSRRHRS